MNKSPLCLIGILLFVMVGCETNSTTSSDKSLPASTKQGTPKQGTEDSAADTDGSSDHHDNVEIPLEIKSWKDVQTWIASQHNKVVVIDLWSTYCGPCRREFPHFVALHDQGNQQIACASVSLDYYGGSSKPESVQPQVLEFLTSKKSSMQNFISSTPDSDVLEAVGSDAVPVTLVYDREGKLYKVFNNDDNAYGAEGFTYDSDIEPLVKQLIQ